MPTKAKHKIVIDTNLWISFLLTSDYSKIDRFFLRENIVLLFSQELIDEFIEVTQRPKFRKYFSLEDLEDLLTKLRTKAEFISVNSIIEICRDPKDNFLLALAKDGKATYLITGDQDLLVLKKIGKSKVITITEYLSKKIARTPNKSIFKARLDNVTSAMCYYQQRFWLHVQCSTLVLNFNKIFSNCLLYRAGQSMNSLPSQILER